MTAGEPRTSADGRFAPSPSADLHLGNLRTALLAWLFARVARARWSVRVDDLDPQRSQLALAERQLEDLAAIGLHWDGPVVHQSARAADYQAALEALISQDLVYRCWCTRAEIRAATQAPHGQLDAYPGTCSRLSAAEIGEREASGRPPALRVRAAGKRIAFTDRLAGPQQTVLDDFVVRRNDGVHAYNLAVVVDDAELGVGEVVRGDDLLPTTARQVWIYDRLGLTRPAHAHVPLMLGPDGERLAKRHGAVTLRECVAAGDSPDRVRGRLAASVGLCADGDAPRLEELLAGFDRDAPL